LQEDLGHVIHGRRQVRPSGYAQGGVTQPGIARVVLFTAALGLCFVIDAARHVPTNLARILQEDLTEELSCLLGAMREESELRRPNLTKPRRVRCCC
jgi:hypothetical protein